MILSGVTNTVKRKGLVASSWQILQERERFASHFAVRVLPLLDLRVERVSTTYLSKDEKIEDANGSVRVKERSL